MQNHPVLLVLILACASTCVAPAPATTRGAPGDIAGARVVAFGDSITNDRARKKWPHWTAVLKERFGLELINAGVNGNTTAQGLARMDRDVLAHEPDFVLISFGMNDHAMRSRNQPKVPIDAFEKNLVAMVEKTRSIGATPVFITTNAIVEGTPGKEHRKYYYDRHD